MILPRAEVGALPAAPNARDLRVREVATAFLRVRPVILAPFLVAAVAVLAATGAPVRQVLALAAGASVFLGVFVVERVRARRREVRTEELARSLLLTLLGIGVASTATGGIVSPLVPMLFAPLGVGFAAFGPSREVRALAAMFGLVVVASMGVAFVAPGLAVPPAGARVVLVLAFVASALLLYVGVSGLTEAHRRAADDLAAAGEALARASEARTRDLESLGSRLAHEVKNPLAAVRALAEVMAETADTKGKKRLAVVSSEVARIQTIVEGYAALARPLDVVRRAPTEVAALLASIVATLEARAERAGVTLELSSPPEGETFPLDERRVHEAVVNLVLNAIEASRPPSSGARVRVLGALGPAGARIVVEDLGVGMSEATASRVGTPFFTRREGGTGLGASHAKAVAALHGGDLAYESEEGRGTRATLVLAWPEGERRGESA